MVAQLLFPRDNNGCNGIKYEIAAMGPKARTAVAAFCSGVAVLIFVYAEFYPKPDDQFTLKYILTIIFSLFATSIGINLLSAAVHEILADRERNTIIERIDALPGLIAEHSDIVLFQDRRAGYRYCISQCSKAKSVRNTVLRYGYPSSADPNDPIYTQWRGAKAASVESLKTAWKEIVSQHLSDEDGQIIFAQTMSSRGLPYYEWRQLDDTKYPMVQMTLFEFESHSEVVFGWEFPANWKGPSILSRNPQIVAYFAKYFDRCFDLQCPKVASSMRAAITN